MVRRGGLVLTAGAETRKLLVLHSPQKPEKRLKLEMRDGLGAELGTHRERIWFDADEFLQIVLKRNGAGRQNLGTSKSLRPRSKPNSPITTDT